MTQTQLLQTRPEFCQYVDEACDKDFSALVRADGLFLYGSEPEPIARTIEAAKNLLTGTGGSWRSWRDLDIAGQMIFCEICRGVRGASTVFADVTTLNFNLLFEIGFCLGLGIPIRPIRDSSYLENKRQFEELGVLETLGYIDFSNAEQLAERVSASQGPPLGTLPAKTFREAPIYVLKGPISTQGWISLLSALRKSPLNFRVHDPEETPRTSLYEQWKQVRGSFGVIANLLTPNRHAAAVHNALCAFLCGIALAEQKAVLLLQEEPSPPQPIDYRDLVQPWGDPDRIADLVAPTISRVIDHMQVGSGGTIQQPAGLLEGLDLGDVAAENEITGLKDYFVTTGPFRLARQGHGRIVVGRKGTGKTAMFFAVSASVNRGHETLVMELIPEAYEFTRLKEVLSDLSVGQREQTVSAFWTYLLTAEIAHRILNSHSELVAAERDPERFRRYEDLKNAYFDHGLASDDDLSRRLLRLIDRLADRFGEEKVTARTDLAELVYGGDIRSLSDAVAAYVAGEKKELWFLIDNLDKGWATRGASDDDIQIVIGLLDATRTIERQMNRRGVLFRCLIFIRTDVLEHLGRASTDRGKEGTVQLDWDDPELFQEIVRRRIEASTDLSGSFDDVWSRIAEPTISVEGSFGYIVDRTLMRPRDVLLFVQRAQQVALNRSHSRIAASDIQQAETGYSEEALLLLGYEMDDTHPGVSDAILSFHGMSANMDADDVQEALVRGGVESKDVQSVVELLLWFGFLGVKIGTADPMYSFGVNFNLRRLLHPIESGTGLYVVHPAFRKALDIED